VIVSRHGSASNLTAGDGPPAALPDNPADLKEIVNVCQAKVVEFLGKDTRTYIASAFIL
jgi:hypothetical protein